MNRLPMTTYTIRFRRHATYGYVFDLFCHSCKLAEGLMTPERVELSNDSDTTLLTVNTEALINEGMEGIAQRLNSKATGKSAEAQATDPMITVLTATKQALERAEEIRQQRGAWGDDPGDGSLQRWRDLLHDLLLDHLADLIEALGLPRDLVTRLGEPAFEQVFERARKLARADASQERRDG